MGFFRTFSVRYMSTKLAPSSLGSPAVGAVTPRRFIHLTFLKKKSRWIKTCCFTHCWPFYLNFYTDSIHPLCGAAKKITFDLTKTFLPDLIFGWPDFVEAPNLRSLGLSAAAAFFSMPRASGKLRSVTSSMLALKTFALVESGHKCRIVESWNLEVLKNLKCIPVFWMGLSTYYCSLASKDCTGILADGTALLEGHTVPKSLKDEGIRHL